MILYLLMKYFANIPVS